MANCLSYAIIYCISILPEDKNEILKAVKDNDTELALFNMWKNIKERNKNKACIGFSISFVLFVFMFYYLSTFSNVWYNWRWSLLIGYLIGLLIDFLLFEFLIEFSISIAYSKVEDKSLYLEDKYIKYSTRVREIRSMS